MTLTLHERAIKWLDTAVAANSKAFEDPDKLELFAMVDQAFQGNDDKFIAAVIKFGIELYTPSSHPEKLLDQLKKFVSGESITLDAVDKMEFPDSFPKILVDALNKKEEQTLRAPRGDETALFMIIRDVLVKKFGADAGNRFANSTFFYVTNIIPPMPSYGVDGVNDLLGDNNPFADINAFQIGGTDFRDSALPVCVALLEGCFNGYVNLGCVGDPSAKLEDDRYISLASYRDIFPSAGEVDYIAMTSVLDFGTIEVDEDSPINQRRIEHIEKSIELFAACAYALRPPSSPGMVGGQVFHFTKRNAIPAIILLDQEFHDLLGIEVKLERRFVDNGVDTREDDCWQAEIRKTKRVIELDREGLFDWVSQTKRRELWLDVFEMFKGKRIEEIEPLIEEAKSKLSSRSGPSL